jgi:hypothetical protein
MLIMVHVALTIALAGMLALVIVVQSAAGLVRRTVARGRRAVDRRDARRQFGPPSGQAERRRMPRAA